VEENKLIDNVGEIKISDEVIAIIADIASKEIHGVIGLSGGLSDVISKKHSAKGVKLEINDRNVKVDLFLNVEYGIRIPDVAWKIQENVKRSIEVMTGMKVENVDIHIQGIQSARKEKSEKSEKNEKRDFVELVEN